jgi:hypothetical protein
LVPPEPLIIAKLTGVFIGSFRESSDYGVEPEYPYKLLAYKLYF